MNGRHSVLYVSPRYPPFVGGTEIHTAEVARRMASRGHDVTVLTTCFTPVATGVDWDDDVRIVRVRSWPADSDLYVAPAVLQTIRGGRWDLIHCQGYHTFVAPMAMAAAVRSHHPFVVTFHSGGHSSALRRFIRPLQLGALRPLLSRASRLIGVSHFETDFFRHRLRLPASRFATITNGVNAEFFHVDAEAATDRSVICSVGRLERYKGHHRVIEALPEVRRAVPDVKLYIVGDGPYRPQLEALSRDVGVDDIVELLVISPHDRRTMAELFRSARLITVLSDYESQGMVGLEAIAAGRPLLVTGGTALSELQSLGDVTIVPPDTDSQTVASIITRKIGEASSPRRDLVPGWDDTVDQLEALYEEVLASRDEAAP